MINRNYKNGCLTTIGIVVVLFLAMAIFISYFVFTGYISAKRHTSYVPEVSPEAGFNSSENSEVKELCNQWFKLKATNSGNIRIEKLDGEVILANLTYFFEYENDQNGKHIKNALVNILNDSVMAITGSVDKDVITNISLTLCRNRPKMDVTVKTSYLSLRTVIRESLIAEFMAPVSEVYLKNCDIDSKPLSGEYWVDKQGVRFGEGSSSALIYHTPGVSSLQINSEKNLLFVNLDYSLDHPLIKIPFQTGGEGKWIDISASQYNPGDERINNFTFYFGSLPKVLPRFMLVPGGYLAGYIFTEHADGGNLRTHRAAYFGSENIKNSKDAVGGFSGHQIPVTKSVFFDEFDEGLNRLPDSTNSEWEYLELLDQLHLLGNDLCLHTPESGNSTRSTMREALMFMKERYDSPSWIDHGMFQGNNNRESFSADGMDSSSLYYAADLWEEADIRYFWSPAVEAIRFANPRPSLDESLKELKFHILFTELSERYNFIRLYKGITPFKALGKVLQGHFPMLELNSQRPFMGHTFPSPLYWQNPTYSGQFYSWPTEFDYYGVTRHLNAANTGDEMRNLDLLIEKRGVFYNHGYYVRNHKLDEFLTLHEGELIINPYFDNVLAYMDQKRDEGDLLLTTVSDFLDYRLQIDNIVLDYKPDGSIDVLNNNNQEVRGLSFAVRCNPESIILKGAEYSYKKDHDDTIIWFNLPAQASVNLTFTTG